MGIRHSAPGVTHSDQLAPGVNGSTWFHSSAVPMLNPVMAVDPDHHEVCAATSPGLCGDGVTASPAERAPVLRYRPQATVACGGHVGLVPAAMPSRMHMMSQVFAHRHERAPVLRRWAAPRCQIDPICVFHLISVVRLAAVQ